MREIKFRAWIPEHKYMPTQGTPDLETLQSFMFHYGDIKNLMQYSGIKDADDVPIYEGDILKWGANGGIVIFKDCAFKHETRKKLNKDRISRWTLLPVYSPYMKVLGNIHENPDLLGNP